MTFYSSLSLGTVVNKTTGDYISAVSNTPYDCSCCKAVTRSQKYDYRVLCCSLSGLCNDVCRDDAM